MMLTTGTFPKAHIYDYNKQQTSHSEQTKYFYAKHSLCEVVLPKTYMDIPTETG